MKSLLITLLVISSSGLYAAESREYKKTSSSEAVVTVKTEEQDATQAAMYVDAKENAKFIADLRKDPNSELAQIIKIIEIQSCDETSTPENSLIEGCGEVVITKEVQTSYGRGGWQEAGGSYTFFVGFRHVGTGRFFASSHMVTISEVAEAQTNGDFEYSGVVIKTLKLEEIQKISNL